ncbi:disintegrin and metalloproteinase domain-containing protein 17-like [Ruditapes philippinarum]|uniref:disintegrin and metalloproteinase domain-containing protein 17-like n=1 Tax=Ruditapes philippinarum TaxID=129788 RepID=UPI00295B0056|nr:disintegrin and metalloproteinase domain-containing protein 17-like [Ruditapes philippinarum]
MGSADWFSCRKIIFSHKTSVYACYQSCYELFTFPTQINREISIYFQKMKLTTLIFGTVFLCIAESSLDDKFHNYDIIKEVSVHTLSKRDITDSLHSKRLTLTAFGQNFTLELKPSLDLFSPDFSVTIIHSDNSKEQLNGFDQKNFLSGHVVGDARSRAALHVDENNVVTGVFTSNGEEFTLEVSAPLCGSVHPNVTDMEESFDEVVFEQYDKDTSHREKRQTTEKKTCKLMVVADYKFYNHMGRGSKYYTANYISEIINRVNQIYRSTSFSLGTGYGFELKGAFGESTEYSSFCLAHLFTAQQMSSSVLGLAYIASSKTGTAGGICSPTRTYNGVPSIFNIGWTSSRNGAGSTVSFTQQSLVTAHGHNWGSEHDPSGSCSPSSIFDDGKYLMYAYAVTGEDTNNDEFSSCSRNSMSAVLRNKASGCFEAASEVTLCGNSRIDPGEECDEGLIGKLGGGDCCTDACQFIPGAQCSPANSACCEQCQLASSTFVCQSDIDGLCQGASTCNGISFDCPTPPNKPDGTECIEGGFCQTGVCIPFCEYMLSTNSCVCDTVETSCKRCCIINGQCQVEGSYLLPDGRSCVQGYCESGVCNKVTTDLVGRLWDLIDEISIDLIVEAFKTNMVACVTGFSLVLYIPLCIIVWCIDKKRKKDWKKENSVHIRTDRGLAHDEDKRPILAKTSNGNKPSTLDASHLMEHDSFRRPNSRGNQIQPLGRKPASSLA